MWCGCTPAPIDRYIADLNSLADALARDQSEGHSEAAAAVRRIVESVNVLANCSAVARHHLRA